MNHYREALADRLADRVSFVVGDAPQVTSEAPFDPRPHLRGPPPCAPHRRPLGRRRLHRVSDTVLEMIRQLARSEVPLSLKTHHLGGFTRSIAG